MKRLTDEDITTLVECARANYLQIGIVCDTDIAALKSIAATNLIILELLLRVLEDRGKVEK